MSAIDALDPPTRDINAPLRFPISNVFKGTTSGITVSGRVCGGVVVAGERLRIVPGDESATVKRTWDVQYHIRMELMAHGSQ